MNVLVTQQFNQAMQQLSLPLQQEAISTYSFVSQSNKEHVFSSSFTKITSARNDLYTLRGKSIRIFCTFEIQGGVEYIVFVDVKKTDDSEITAETEKTLFGARGEPIAYIDSQDEQTIYSFSGEPLAYLDNHENIYGFNGKHLGWFEDQIVWDHSGKRVGFTKSTCPSFTQFEPFKGFKQFKPFRSFQRFAPFKPFKSLSNSDIGLLEFLKMGKK